MKIAIHQPNFLPWLGFFYKASQVDLLVLLDDVQFIKRGLTHRNYIKGPAGRQLIGVPVITKGRYHQTIDQVEINSTDSRWGAKVVQSLKHAYGKRPSAVGRLDHIAEILLDEWKYLHELNTALLDFMFNCLAIQTRVVRSSELPNIHGASTERLVSICRATGATEYLSGAGGKKYQDEQAFAAAGLTLTYSAFSPPEYPQPFGEFAAGLSALDYILNMADPSQLFAKRRAA